MTRFQLRETDCAEILPRRYQRIDRAYLKKENLPRGKSLRTRCVAPTCFVVSVEFIKGVRRDLTPLLAPTGGDKVRRGGLKAWNCDVPQRLHYDRPPSDQLFGVVAQPARIAIIKV